MFDETLANEGRGTKVQGSGRGTRVRTGKEFFKNQMGRVVFCFTSVTVGQDDAAAVVEPGVDGDEIGRIRRQ